MNKEESPAAFKQDTLDWRSFMQTLQDIYCGEVLKKGAKEARLFWITKSWWKWPADGATNTTDVPAPQKQQNSSSAAEYKKRFCVSPNRTTVDALWPIF